MPTFYIDGRKVEQEDRFSDGSAWFDRMLLPDRADAVGPFTPIEFARHRSWGVDPAWSSRHAIYAPMQDSNDTYNCGFWPVKQCEPAELVRVSTNSTRDFRACVFNY